MVGRVTPCAPFGAPAPVCGAHGVTRHTCRVYVCLQRIETFLSPYEGPICQCSSLLDGTVALEFVPASRNASKSRISSLDKVLTKSAGIGEMSDMRRVWISALFTRRR